MIVDQCSMCRFWLRDPMDKELDLDGGFGWCRRRPPVIIDHMAQMSIARPGFGGHIIDPEEVASPNAVETASLYPATYYTSWCGEFEPSLRGVA